jgi:hypothetical protein
VQQTERKPLFELGQLVATPDALTVLFALTGPLTVATSDAPPQRSQLITLSPAKI